MRSLNTSKSALEHVKDVTMPVGLLKLLLQVAIAYGDFDEESYLRSNPDVRDAINRGEIESGQLHYIGFGYFEGRKGVAVDESWYLEKYPDVALAVKEGRVDSATRHFNSIGAGEGAVRVPINRTMRRNGKKPFTARKSCDRARHLLADYFPADHLFRVAARLQCFSVLL